MTAPRARGFTIIELMIAFAILSILGTIAIPGFQRQLLKTKTTERRVVMLAIKRAIQDYYVRNGSAIPPSMSSPLVSNPNPPSAPGVKARVMSASLPEWNAYFSGGGATSSLPEEILGAVYYRYSFTVVETADSASITIVAEGDLDGDGDPSWKRMTFTRVSGVYQLLPGGEWPAEGHEDFEAFGTF